jgi:hypothetical protein
MIKDYKKLSRKTVIDLGKSMIIGALESKGYSVNFEGPYLRAHLNDDDNDLLIYCASKEFSRKTKRETTQFKVEDSAINKLKNYADESQDVFNLCIAYSLIKYQITDLEVVIIPVQAIENNAEVGGVYSRSSEKYYYNYDAIKNDELPPGGILRILWSSSGLM